MERGAMDLLAKTSTAELKIIPPYCIATTQYRGSWSIPSLKDSACSAIGGNASDDLHRPGLQGQRKLVHRRLCSQTGRLRCLVDTRSNVRY